MMDQPSRKLLLLGEPDGEEFQPVVKFLRSLRADATQKAADVVGLRQLVGEGWHPDLIVVFEAWPDQYSEAEALELVTLCPLARIVCCFGPWCDSAGRTRSIWPLAVRVPVAAAQRRIAREMAMLENRPLASRPLPLTASRAEIFEFDFGLSASMEPHVISARVVSPDRRWRKMLQSSIAKRGFRISAEGESGVADVVLYDADPWDSVREAGLRSLRAASAQAKLIACTGFPHFDLGASLSRAGADNVWFKLAPLEELVANFLE
jgi:hypothetical protein